MVLKIKLETIMLCNINIATKKGRKFQTVTNNKYSALKNLKDIDARWKKDTLERWISNMTALEDQPGIEKTITVEQQQQKQSKTYLIRKRILKRLTRIVAICGLSYNKISSDPIKSLMIECINIGLENPGKKAKDLIPIFSRQGRSREVRIEGPLINVKILKSLLDQYTSPNLDVWNIRRQKLIRYFISIT
ncbi:MAG: hypothetical protein EZS28_024567 [Streblomastix strix]|uniref:Uncharacterized protein n=1 Tax=Streblomastix strix TaxID=222440 RepID=A0A5J4VBH1_9EUKA|nr:MAG: hypothetical protein EZS28_024567 [Streblomastix strix]